MPTRPKSISLAPQAVQQAAHRKKSKSFLNSGTWLRLRTQVLIEQPLCLDCPADHKKLSVQVHHLKERSTHPELALVRENLIGLCESCHTIRHRGRPSWR